uniref:Uncharacterized protein n=1 Tax=Anguilla anguilla TaxID=7936 RepID=A0A0E9T184_ANGAN
MTEVQTRSFYLFVFIRMFL